MSKNIRSCFLLVALFSAFSVASAAPKADFVTPEGYQATCAEQLADPLGLKTDAERLTFVICRDTDLARQIITWLNVSAKRFDFTDIFSDNEKLRAALASLQAEVDYASEQLGVTRKVLEKIQLGQQKSLLLKPSSWQMDLDGDDVIDTWEQYFFAIPTRGLKPFRLAMPNNDLAYYEREYQLDAQIRVDQSDVLWALSYHNFIEGLLLHVQALDISFSNADSDNWRIVIARPQLLKAAHVRIAAGFANAEKMRRSVLAEKTDDHEWIAHPRQRSSVFPIPLTDADFAHWGRALAEIQLIWSGQHLLPTGLRDDPLFDMFYRLCPQKRGLNIASFYQKPAVPGTEIFPHNKALTVDLIKHCQVPSKQRPYSILPTILESSLGSAVGMDFMRSLYWVN